MAQAYKRRGRSITRRLPAALDRRPVKSVREDTVRGGALRTRGKADEDGSYTVYFGPQAPEGKEANWVQTMPNKSFFVFLRLYGPLEPWFDKTWKPGDFEKLN